MEPFRGLRCQVRVMGSNDAEMTADAAAWTDLSGDHGRRLRGLAAAITFDSSMADEIVQDAFAGLIARGDEVQHPEAYLQRSVINLAINAVRRRQRSSVHPVRPTQEAESPTLDGTWSVIGELSPHQRAVVVTGARNVAGWAPQRSMSKQGSACDQEDSP